MRVTASGAYGQSSPRKRAIEHQPGQSFLCRKEQSWAGSTLSDHPASLPLEAGQDLSNGCESTTLGNGLPEPVGLTEGLPRTDQKIDSGLSGFPIALNELVAIG